MWIESCCIFLLHLYVSKTASSVNTWSFFLYSMYWSHSCSYLLKWIYILFHFFQTNFKTFLFLPKYLLWILHPHFRCIYLKWLFFFFLKQPPASEPTITLSVSLKGYILENLQEKSLTVRKHITFLWDYLSSYNNILLLCSL